MLMVANPPTFIEKAKELWQKEDIPPEFAWIEKLTPLHQRLFIAELHDALGSACINDEWERVAHLVEDWEATACLDANPEFAQYLKTELTDDDYEELDVSELAG